MLRALAAKELIKKEPGKSRSVTVLIPQSQLPED